MAIKTGYTASLGNASGIAEGANGKVSVTYRGVENGWGNIWKWLDGFNIYRDSTKSQHDLYYADHGYADDTGATPYKKFNATLCQTEGYVSAFAYEADGDMDCLLQQVKLKALVTGVFVTTSTEMQAILAGWRLGSVAAGIMVLVLVRAI